MEVYCASPLIPFEWIKAHGLEPRPVWLESAEGLPAPSAGMCAFAHQAGWRPKARLQGWLGLFLLARIAKTYERSLAQAMPPLPPAPRESWPPAPEISREPLPLRDERGTLPDHL